MNTNTITLDKEYKYRNDEQPARVICIDNVGPFTVVSVDSRGETHKHSDDGRSPYTKDMDLIEVREPREFWLILPNGGKGEVYTTRQDHVFPSIRQILVREVI